MAVPSSRAVARKRAPVANACAATALDRSDAWSSSGGTALGAGTASSSTARSRPASSTARAADWSEEEVRPTSAESCIIGHHVSKMLNGFINGRCDSSSWSWPRRTARSRGAAPERLRN